MRLRNRYPSARLALASILLLAVGAGCGDGSGGGGGGGAGGGGGDGDDAGMDAAVPTVDVEGVVIDQLTGMSVGGASVFVADAPGVVSDGQGRFRVEGVAPPYDVAVRAGGSDRVTVFRGIERRAPTIVIDADAPSRSANVSGAAIASEGTEVGDRLECNVSDGRHLRGYTTAVSAGVSPIAWDLSDGFQALWYGARSVDGTLRCLLARYEDGTLTAAFLGSRAVTLADGGTFSDQDMTLASVALATVSGNIIDPMNAASIGVQIGFNFVDSSGFYSPAGSFAPGQFSQVVPYVPGSLMVAGAYDDGRRSAVEIPASATAMADIVLLTRPTVAVPEAGAAGVSTRDPIEWNGTSAHVSLVTIELDGGPVAQVLTTGTKVELPDLARFGLSYPAGGAAVVRIIEYGHLPSVDALTEDATRLMNLARMRGSYQLATSAPVAFTFAE